jgi:hypothetical protein
VRTTAWRRTRCRKRITASSDGLHPCPQAQQLAVSAVQAAKEMVLECKFSLPTLSAVAHSSPGLFFTFNMQQAQHLLPSPPQLALQHLAGQTHYGSAAMGLQLWHSCEHLSTWNDACGLRPWMIQARLRLMQKHKEETGCSSHSDAKGHMACMPSCNSSDFASPGPARAVTACMPWNAAWLTRGPHAGGVALHSVR